MGWGPPSIDLSHIAPHLASPLLGEEIAVAVSGGADSMALLLLLHAWVKPRGIRLHALTVDHRLRPGSTQEAQQVARWCAERAIAHTILAWEHPPLHSGIEEQAREARYRLMGDWCRAQGIAHLFTGHHQGDQVETFFFRLARGSGLEGLSGIRPASYRSGLWLHRPLLAVSKQQLLSYLAQQHQSWLQDESNDDLRFTRNHIRAQLQRLSEAQALQVSQLTHFFEKFRNLLEDNIYTMLETHVEIHPAGYAWLHAQRLESVPQGLRAPLLSTLCQVISGNATPLRSEKLARLEEVVFGPATTAKTTLHGTVFSYRPKEQAWLISREAARIAEPLSLTTSPQLWDGRFTVRLSGEAEGYHITHLGPKNGPFREALEKTSIPKSIWPTLAAITHLEEVVAIPHILWNRNAFCGKIDVCFVPVKPIAALKHEMTNKRFK